MDVMNMLHDEFVEKYNDGKWLGAAYDTAFERTSKLMGAKCSDALTVDQEVEVSKMLVDLNHQAHLDGFHLGFAVATQMQRELHTYLHNAEVR